MFILMNWRIVRDEGTPGGGITRISGNVYGHSGFRPGDSITTSRIASYRLESDFIIVTTCSGSDYSLEKPCPTEPFARQRLIRYLNAQPGNPRSPRGRPAVETGLLQDLAGEFSEA